MLSGAWLGAEADSGDHAASWGWPARRQLPGRSVACFVRGKQVSYLSQTMNIRLCEKHICH